jgi:hypothetical protein
MRYVVKRGISLKVVLGEDAKVEMTVQEAASRLGAPTVYEPPSVTVIGPIGKFTFGSKRVGDDGASTKGKNP